MRKCVTGYMDKVSFEYDLGHAACGDKVYPSIKSLKKEQPCTKTCGVVKVQVRLVKVVEEESAHDLPGSRCMRVRFDKETKERISTIGTYDENRQFVPDNPQPKPEPTYFVRNTVIRNPEAAEELEAVLKKYNIKFERHMEKH